jgi:hypothetical protein
MIGTKKELVEYLQAQNDNKLFELKEKDSQRTLQQNKVFYKLFTDI